VLTVFSAAFGLGLLFNAAPGPVFAETVRRGIQDGFRSALAVQIGSIVGDAVWAVLGLMGVGLLLRLESLRLPVALAGVAYLIWLAWGAWRESRRDFMVNANGHSRQKALKSGILLSLTNPQNVAYWAAMGSALRAVGVTVPTPFDYGAFFAGFMLSSTVWAFFFAALVDRMFRRIGRQWARITYRVCAIAFLALALSMLRELWITHQQPRSSPASRLLEEVL
jgi:chemosensory pili system protein ChpE/L-lysine exporter family protein LysE/ArgO